MYVTIGFSKGKGPLADLIQFVTGSKITHAYIRHGSEITQASGVKVNTENIQDFIKHAEIIDEILVTLSEEEFRLAERFRLAALNSPYSITQLIGFPIILLGRRFGLNLRNPLANGSHSYICSELVARYLNLDNPEELSPSDVYHILKLRR